jgi:hypothetical protein
MTKYLGNPKLLGTNIIDCIPQTGECPKQCPECFYNGGRFFRTLDEPWMPSEEDVGHKIVRVNSGHDSNIDKDLVLEKTKHYGNKFYNTSVPDFNFPDPVVFTCNGGKNSFIKLVPPTSNLMFVRVRTNSWDLSAINDIIDHYWKIHGIPVVLTFMRYYNGDLIPKDFKKDYEWKKSILNEYFCIKQEAILRIMARFRGTGLKMCGTPVSSTCIDCGNCENYYWQTRNKMLAEVIMKNIGEFNKLKQEE